MELERLVREYCRRQGLLDGVGRVAAGVSGGADSVCLLRVLAALRQEGGPQVTAVHVLHGIRGEEAMEDAQFVRQLCARWEVPFRLFSFDVPQLARERGCSLEEAGRQARYEAFQQAAQEEGAQAVAVAHNMDDQAETLLLNLARGTGLRGMSGMAPERSLGPVKLVRPLLCVRRSDIEAYLGGLGQEYRTDSTNLQDVYTRNRVRLHVMPALAQVNERAAEHMAQACQAAREAQEYMQEQARRLMGQASVTGGQQTSVGSGQVMSVSSGQGAFVGSGQEVAGDGGARPLALRIPLSLLQAQPQVMRKYMLLEGIRRLSGSQRDMGQAHVDALLSLAAGEVGRRASLPGGIEAWREYEALCLCRAAQGRARDGGLPVGGDCGLPAGGDGRVPAGGDCGCKKAAIRESLALRVPGEFVLEDGTRIRLSLEEWKKEQNIPIKRYTKWLDYDRIEDSLELRTRRPGDYLVIGRDGGRKKLKDYLIDEKVERSRRDRLLLLAAGSHVLWALGMRIGEDVKITEKTKRVLKIQVYGGSCDGREDTGADSGGEAGGQNQGDRAQDQ